MEKRKIVTNTVTMQCNFLIMCGWTKSYNELIQISLSSWFTPEEEISIRENFTLELSTSQYIL